MVAKAFLQVVFLYLSKLKPNQCVSLKELCQVRLLRYCLLKIKAKITHLPTYTVFLLKLKCFFFLQQEIKVCSREFAGNNKSIK